MNHRKTRWLSLRTVAHPEGSPHWNQPLYQRWTNKSAWPLGKLGNPTVITAMFSSWRNKHSLLATSSKVLLCFPCLWLPSLGGQGNVCTTLMSTGLCRLWNNVPLETIHIAIPLGIYMFCHVHLFSAVEELRQLSALLVFSPQLVLDLKVYIIAVQCSCLAQWLGHLYMLLSSVSDTIIL